MDNVTDFVRSIINSCLGPNKNNKLIIQGKDMSFTRCPLYILQNNHLLDSTSLLVEETLFAHHELFGCSTLSLLAMWYFWKEEFRIALEDGCNMQSIVKHSQDILELAISAVSDVSLSIEEMLYPKESCPKVAVCQNSIRKPNDFNQMPVSIRYSSRHFSPSQNFCGEDSKVDEKFLRTVIQSIDHDENIVISELVLKCWNKHVISTGCSKFLGDGILIFPITLPYCSSTVVDGLLLKSNLNHTWHQDMKHGDTNRTLIIMGSITYQYVHLGFSPKVSISTRNSFSKEQWSKMCCDFILQHKISILLVREDIGQEIASFCFAHEVLVFSHIPLKVFKILCNALQQSPCTYLWDCTEENIIKNLTVKEWKPNDHHLDSKDQYFMFNMHLTSTLPLQTIVLFHPSPAVLGMMKHQTQHLISRLSLCFQSGRLLMGGGEAEMWCADFLKKHSQFQKPTDQRTRIVAALTNGYQNYGTVVQQKMEMLANTTTKKMDEMSSKVNAWRSALALALLTLQCNMSIVNGVVGDVKIGEHT